MSTMWNSRTDFHDFVRALRGAQIVAGAANKVTELRGVAHVLDQLGSWRVAVILAIFQLAQRDVHKLSTLIVAPIVVGRRLTVRLAGQIHLTAQEGVAHGRARVSELGRV